MDGTPGYVELLSGGGGEDLIAKLDLSVWVEDDPELVAVVMVLARKDAARVHGDDLNRAGNVVGVLLEPAPGLLYF